MHFAKFYPTLRSLVQLGEIEEDVERTLIVVGGSGMRRGELYALRFEDIIEGAASHPARGLEEEGEGDEDR